MVKANSNIMIFTFINGDRILGKLIDKINDGLSPYYVVQNPIELYLDEDHGTSQLFQFIDYPTMNDSDLIMIQPNSLMMQSPAAKQLREYYNKAMNKEPSDPSELIKVHEHKPVSKETDPTKH